MKNEEVLMDEAINDWNHNLGVGTMYLPNNYNSNYIIANIIGRLVQLNKLKSTLIIVPTFTDRQLLMQDLFSCDNENIVAAIKEYINNNTIKIYSESFVKNSTFTTNLNLLIVVDCSTMYNSLVKYIDKSTFKLVILTNHMSTSDSAVLHSLVPVLNVFKQEEVLKARLSTPVEEIRVGVTINDSSIVDELEKRDNFIKTSLNIFGSFDLIKEGFSGNATINLSAQDVCDRIARENGWSENLDMSVDINRELDILYNPNSLRERAATTYNIIRERNQLISDYNGKLNAILEIIKEHENEKVLIINKRAEFATTVAEYLNMHSDKQIAAAIHDKLESINMVDANGNNILYKNGANKGKPRVLGAQAQCTKNVELFNNDTINVLSASSSPNKNLNIEVDVIIITSPMCSTLEEYLYRLNNLYIKNSPLKLYYVYCNDTIEERKLNYLVNKNHTILSKNDKKIIFDKSCGVIIC